MADQRRPTPRRRTQQAAETPRRRTKEVLEVTEISDVSFADAASKAFEKGRKLGAAKKKKITYANIVKFQIVTGSTQYVATLRFPEY